MAAPEEVRRIVPFDLRRWGIAGVNLRASAVVSGRGKL